VFNLKILVTNCLSFSTYEYVNILRTILIIETLKTLLLCSATFKKTCFQIYFNKVSLGCKHSGVNTLAQTRGEERKKERKRKERREREKERKERKEGRKEGRERKEGKKKDKEKLRL
jgi:hypothetical protein